MVRLTRLKIDRFRNLAPGTDLHFGPTFNVLLGRNATGKTTLLDLIAAVTNDDLSAYAGEEAGYDLTWWLEADQYAIEVRAARSAVPATDDPRARLSIPLHLHEHTHLVVRERGNVIATYRAEGNRGTATLGEEAPLEFENDGDLTKARAIGLLVSSSGGGQISPWVLIFLIKSAMERFDEGTQALNTLCNLPFSSPADFFTRRMQDWLPEAFWDQLAAAKVQGLDFASIPSLSAIPTLLGFQAAEMRPRLQSHSEAKDTFHGFNFLFSRSNGSQISHSLLSFGQKRLFAFLWYLAARGDLPVVADELLNGLHHEWIEACLDRLYDRQSFLATQHPLLLDHLPIANAEAVKTTFVRCSIHVDVDRQEQLTWRNFNDEEAQRFLVAYETGIQHVSEVLRSEGLW